MFKYASLKEQLIYEQQESAAFKAQNEKNTAEEFFLITKEVVE